MNCSLFIINCDYPLFIYSIRIISFFLSHKITCKLMWRTYTPLNMHFQKSYALQSHQFSSVQSLSPVWLFMTLWITACQASLSIVNSQSSIRLMSIESVMPPSHLILCRPLLLLPPIPPGYGFSSSHVWMWEFDCEEGWAPKNWFFWTVVLEKTLECLLNCKEIPPVHSEGDQPWDFFGRKDAKAETPVLWPPHEKSWLVGK